MAPLCINILTKLPHYLRFFIEQPPSIVCPGMAPFWPDVELGKACLWCIHTLLSTMREYVYSCKIHAISTFGFLLSSQIGIISLVLLTGLSQPHLFSDL